MSAASRLETSIAASTSAPTRCPVPTPSASTSSTEPMRIRQACFSIAVAAALSLGACNDEKFLTETPHDFVGPGEFYRNAGDAVAAVNSVYALFINGSGDNYYGRNFPMLVDFPTEMLTAGRLGGTNERSLPDNFAE